jgi:hypothetical protein
MRYWLDVWQPWSGGISARISVNNGGWGIWNFSSATMPTCVGGRWDYGEKKYHVQGSVYLNHAEEEIIFTLTNFFPWSSMNSHHQIGDTGTGLFKKPPIKVTQDNFNWKIIDKQED